MPTNGVGGMAQWAKALGTRQHVQRRRRLALGRWRQPRRTRITSRRCRPVGHRPPVTHAATLALKRVSGGTQQTAGAFVQDIFTPLPKLTVTLSARVDHWRNYDGHNLETDGRYRHCRPPTTGRRCRIETTPSSARASRAMYHVTDRVSVWGAVSSGFRAPTLNELYRQFRVGTVLDAGQRSARPGAAGGRRSGRQRRARRRTPRGATTWFDNRVENPVGERDAVDDAGADARSSARTSGRRDIWGVQTDLECRIGPAFGAPAAAYLYNQATVTDVRRPTPALVGKFLPQVPQNRATFQLVVLATRGKFNAAIGCAGVGLQFDDDQNIRAVSRRRARRSGILDDARSRAARLPIGGHHRVTRHQSQLRGVLRRAEPAEQGVSSSARCLSTIGAASRQRRHEVRFSGQ